jgi:DNA-binding transcriptional MerR regulator
MNNFRYAFEQLVRRLRGFLRRSAFERDVDEEMQFHRDMAAQHGLSPAAFGSAARYKEEVSDARGIRYYERIGLLSPPERKHGQRRYSADVIESLALVRLGRSLGFSLLQLQELTPSEWRKEAPGHWPAVFRERLGEIRATMAQPRSAERVLIGALSCACADITTCVRNG